MQLNLLNEKLLLKLKLKISTDATNWSHLKSFTGLINQWSKVQIDLNDYVGSNIYIRFRIQSDKTIVGDGWFIDEICIGEKPTPILSLAIENTTNNSSIIVLNWTQNSDSPEFSGKQKGSHPFLLQLLHRIYPHF